MNDLKPFKHGEEGTHYVCQEVLELKGGKATCCGCSGHKCKKPKPMKRIKKECKNCKSEAGKWIAVEYRKNGDAICSVCGKIVSKCLNPKPQEKCHCCEWKSPDHLQEDGSCNHCPHHCSPKPTKIKCGLKHKHGYWNCCACCIQGEVKGEGAWGHVKECEFYPKIKKKLVIKEEWCETTFEQQKDRLYVHMRYFEDDDSGGKWEGGSSSFSVPLKKLKDYLLSH